MNENISFRYSITGFIYFQTADNARNLFVHQFSAVDAVNHFFGPSSLENEDVVVQLDRTLADLFKFINETVGLNHTLVVLVADHGMADMPEYMTVLGYKAGRLDPDEILAAANKVGQKFGVEEIVRFFYRPYLYLDDEKIAAAKLDRMKEAQVIAEALTKFNGIALAVASSKLASQDANPLVAQVRLNYRVSRSGDIYFEIRSGRRSVRPGQGIAKPDGTADGGLQLQVKLRSP